MKTEQFPYSQYNILSPKCHTVKSAIYHTPEIHLFKEYTDGVKYYIINWLYSNQYFFPVQYVSPCVTHWLQPPVVYPASRLPHWLGTRVSEQGDKIPSSHQPDAFVSAAEGICCASRFILPATFFRISSSDILS